MKPRRSLFDRLAALFQRRRAIKPQPIPAPRPPREPKARGIEPLEGRVAPATLLNPHAISFDDLDGDIVTVTFTKSFLTADNVGNIFKFSDGTQTSLFASTGPQQLQLIDLTQAPRDLTTFVSKAEGTSLTVSAAKGAGNAGDDLTNVGAIKATGIALDRVQVGGDLGQIDCGRSEAKVGLNALIVNSLYKFGATTQVSGGTAADQLESKITGVLTALDVKTDLFGYLHVVDGTFINADNNIGTNPAQIGSVKIGGSLRGNATVAATSDTTGTIESQRGIGVVQILGVNDPADATDAAGLVGGGGKNSGSLIAGTGIGAITIADSLTGGGGQNSGSITGKTTLASVTIGGDVLGGAGVSSGSIQAATLTHGMIGGKLGGSTADTSGAIKLTQAINHLTVTGGLSGGTGANSGSIIATKSLSSVSVTGDVSGGDGANSGSIISNGSATAIHLGGKLTGGAGASSGAISVSTTLGSAKVMGDVTGGGGSKSGSIFASGLTPLVNLGGKLTGGAGTFSGCIDSAFGLGSVKVAGDVTGGTADRSGTIITDGTITSISVGKLVGGSGPSSGAILAATDPLLHGAIVSASVANGLLGGDGLASGSIVAGKLGTMRVASVLGGAGDFSGAIVSNSSITLANVVGSIEGGGGRQSGSVQAHGAFAAVNVTGDLKGGAGDFSGLIRAQEIIDDDFTGTAASLGSVTIHGNILGGGGASSGRVEASGNFGIFNAASLKAGAGVGSGAIVAGGGFLAAGNATSITVTGAITSDTGTVDPTVNVRGRLGAFVAGSLTDALVRVGRDLAAATIKGDVLRSTISAVGQAAPVPMLGDVALGSLLVSGDVTDSHIFAGYDLNGAAVNADASIGLVRVHGNWTASDLVAGVKDVNGDGFGNADDAKITGGTDRAGLVSQIASVIIHGSVAGTAGGSDHFGFTAQRILAFQAGGISLGFTSASGQSFDLGATGDVSAREVPV